MEDLSLGRIAALVPAFPVKDLPLGRTMMIMIVITIQISKKKRKMKLKEEIT